MGDDDVPTRVSRASSSTRVSDAWRRWWTVTAALATSIAFIASCGGGGLLTATSTTRSAPRTTTARTVPTTTTATTRAPVATTAAPTTTAPDTTPSPPADTNPPTGIADGPACIDDGTALAIVRAGWLPEATSVDELGCVSPVVAVGSAWLDDQTGTTVAFHLVDGQWSFLSGSFGLRDVCTAVWRIDPQLDIGCGTSFLWPYGGYFDVPQLGAEPVRGSGCGSAGQYGDALPDGVYNVRVASIGSASMAYDLQCIFFGDAAQAMIDEWVAEHGDDELRDDASWWEVNNSDRLRTVPVSPSFIHRDAQWDDAGCNDPGPEYDVVGADATLFKVIHSWLIIQGGQAVFLLTSCPYG